MDVISAIARLTMDKAAQERLIDKIRRERIRRNCSQREFGRILGVSYSTVRSWEKGDSFPRVDGLAKIAEYFGIEVSTLLEGLELKPKEKSNRPNIDEVISSLDRFSSSEIHKLLEAALGRLRQAA